MKRTITIAAVAAGLVVTLVPETAEAQYGGRHRRTRRRTAVVVHSATKSQDAAQVNAANQQAAAAKQEAATAEQHAAAADKEAAAAKQQAAPPPPAVAAGQPLPVGTVVSQLPPGSVATPVGGVEYYYSNGNFYRAVYEGNHLVYVTEKPK